MALTGQRKVVICTEANLPTKYHCMYALCGMNSNATQLLLVEHTTTASPGFCHYVHHNTRNMHLTTLNH
jgi:hypothetical protein